MEQQNPITEGRRRRRMSQEMLAQASGVSVRTVARAEQGARLSDENLRALCAVLDLDASEIAPETPAPRRKAGEHVELRPVGRGPRASAVCALLKRYVRDSIPGAEAMLAPDMATWRRRVGVGSRRADPDAHFGRASRSPTGRSG